MEVLYTQWRISYCLPLGVGQGHHLVITALMVKQEQLDLPALDRLLRGPVGEVLGVIQASVTQLAQVTTEGWGRDGMAKDAKD